MSESRRPVHFNSSALSWTSPPPSDDAHLVQDFHTRLPGYQPTRLTPLEQVAREAGVGAVYVKDESDRLSLPSFKILGASWGTFRSIVQRLGLPLDSSIDDVRKAAAAAGLKLFAATDGNHGRAVARMGTVFGVAAQIHVPAGMHVLTKQAILDEGADMVESTGNYDQSIFEARDAAQEHPSGILVQDYAFAGYEELPQWIVEGYQTMVLEIDTQLGEVQPDVVICPVGVGSLAQSVVSHFKQAGRKTSVITVEPDTAACLWKSLKAGKPTPTDTTSTIMAGLECGTVSSIAWSCLSQGVSASLTVSDYESHLACLDLNAAGVPAGPCGSSPLAALRRLTGEDRTRLGLNEKSVVVLICSEKSRAYDVPMDVTTSEPAALTQKLVQIDSSSPALGWVPGPGETAIARYIKAWLEHRDIESHWIEPTLGRPSVVGVVRGSGGGKSVMFNGHIDTVTLLGYDGNPLSGDMADGRLYGRGSADMKCGVAAALAALAKLKTLNLRGDVIFAGVADEEASSIGTEQVLTAGWAADAAIVNEPTNLEIVHAHKGFVWLEVDIHGVAAHGSRPDLGVDAIVKAGSFLTEISRYSDDLKRGRGGTDDRVGTPSVHASIIKGGEEVSSYPALCTISLEYRTIPGQTSTSVKEEIEGLLKGIAAEDPDFKYDIRATFHRSPFGIPLDSPLANVVGRHVGKALGREPVFRGEPFWTDCALLADAGIPCLLWGPKGEGFHAKEEWVDVESIRTVSETLVAIATEFCS